MLQVIKIKSRHMSITPKIGNYDSKHETIQSFRRDDLNFIKENEKSSSKKINNKFNESISSKSNSLKNSFESSSNSSFDSYYNASVLDNRLIKSSKHSSIQAAKFKWKKALGAIRFKNMLLKEKASEFGEDNDDSNNMFFLFIIVLILNLILELEMMRIYLLKLLKFLQNNLNTNMKSNKYLLAQIFIIYFAILFFCIKF